MNRLVAYIQESNGFYMVIVAKKENCGQENEKTFILNVAFASSSSKECEDFLSSIELEKDFNIKEKVL